MNAKFEFNTGERYGILFFFCVCNDNNGAQKCKILLQAKYLNVGMIFFLLTFYVTSKTKTINLE